MQALLHHLFIVITIIHTCLAQCQEQCWLFVLLQRRQKASTALGIVREYSLMQALLLHM